jgi:hypothetical protein
LVTPILFPFCDFKSKESLGVLSPFPAAEADESRDGGERQQHPGPGIFQKAAV